MNKSIKTTLKTLLTHLRNGAKELQAYHVQQEAKFNSMDERQSLYGSGHKTVLNILESEVCIEQINKTSHQLNVFLENK